HGRWADRNCCGRNSAQRLRSDRRKRGDNSLDRWAAPLPDAAGDCHAENRRSGARGYRGSCHGRRAAGRGRADRRARGDVGPDRTRVERASTLAYGLSSTGFQRGFTETMPIYGDIPWILPRSLDVTSPLYRRTISTLQWDPAGEAEPKSQSGAAPVYRRPKR